MENWINPLINDLEISVLTKILPTKGHLAWEYNPLRNYRVSKDMYEYKNGLYSLDELKSKFDISLGNNEFGKEIWLEGKIPISVNREEPICRLKGELCDFITDELNFDIEHPIHIIPQYSYDGSVNLIFNDGINQPRLINTRFSATGKNTYEIVDRKGNNDTNIYDQGEQFDIDTSLYKRVINIPKLQLVSVTSGGQLSCGNYHFYFKYADTDGNETDFVAESGLVSLFIGENDPACIYTGQRNENTNKQVLFKLSNIDSSYNYVSVYFSRKTAEDNANHVTYYKK